MQPSSGRLRLFGKETTYMPRSVLPAIRRKIGMVKQNFQLLEHLSVADNVALPLRVIGEDESEISSKVAEILEWIGLKDFANEKPFLLSGGEQQRVAIARAVINNPPLLIADEPSGNLDSSLSKKLMYLFEALNKMGTTVIFATHDDSLVDAFDYPEIHIADGVLSKRESRKKEKANIPEFNNKVLNVAKVPKKKPAKKAVKKSAEKSAEKQKLAKKNKNMFLDTSITLPTFGK